MLIKSAMIEHTNENIFLTRNSAADRSMLLITRLPSKTTFGIDAKFELSKILKFPLIYKIRYYNKSFER